MKKQNKVDETVWKVLLGVENLLLQYNQEERINQLTREKELLKGNLDEIDKRLRALERYLQVSYKEEKRYEKISN